jgi:superfamily II DNA or RNA helicase
MTMTTSRQLRSYQQEGYDDIIAEWAQGINRTVIVHATGLGKTDIIAKLCVDEAQAGGIAMVIAHRSEPLDQFTARVAEYAPIPVGRIQAERNETQCRILAASVQTLCRSKRIASCPKPTMLIIDECHHAMADSYWDIMKWAGSFEGKGTRTVGFTATLYRADGQALDPLFTSVADVKGIDWAITNGWLVEPFGRVIELRSSLDHIRVVAGDLSASGVGGVIEQDARRIVRGWLQEGQNRITVAFCPTIESARVLLGAFQAAGVTAELVIGATPHEDRADIYARLAAGVTRVLVNVGVATEAWDCPAVSCVLIARMTQSAGLYEQMIGRGLRLHPGKTDCLVLDVVGVTRKFQLVTLIDIRNPRNHGSDRQVYRSMPDIPRSSGKASPRKWWQRTKYTDVHLLPKPSIGRRVFNFLFKG